MKDDGCNTNVISKEFFYKHRHMFKAKRVNIKIAHSDKNRTESANWIVKGATLQIGQHVYQSNFAVANCRYDVLLGMPWHSEVIPTVDYGARKVIVGAEQLPLYPGSSEGIEVSALGIKKFRSMLKKKGGKEDFEVFQVVPKPLDFANIKKRSQGDQEIRARLEELLKDHETVFRNELPDGLPPVRSVDHEIEIDEKVRPPNRPLFQLSPAELVAVKEYIVKLLQQGKIRRSQSPFGASLFFVKERGKLRGVVDYRALNRITKRNNTPLPRTDEMFDRLGEACFFSKMDLKTGFHQIRVKDSDIEKTAFNTKYGKFEYLVLPMGLCNAPATFQTLMNKIFADVMDIFIVVYMDDLLVFSRTKEEHFKHLRFVLRRLKEHQLYVSPKKCSFFQEEVDFLGLVVGKRGIRVGDDRIRVIRDWKKPTTITELRSFLGLLQFFRRFIKGFSEIAAPLTNLTRKNLGLRKWDKTCDAAFEAMKKALVTAPIVMAPRWDRDFTCHTDASQFAVGATLTQKDEEGKTRVIAYFSRRLNKAEENYSANDRELLALVYALQRFRCYLEGSSFEVITDNQVLRSFFSKPNLSRRETRWVEYLSQFGITAVALKAGKLHVLGDALSRLPHAPVVEEVEIANTEAITLALPGNFEKNYLSDATFGPVVRHFQGEEQKDAIQEERVRRLAPLFEWKDNRLWYESKLCVPRRNVREILQLAHDSTITGHFGFEKTMNRLEQFHWKHKSRDVRLYCQGCIVCQQQKDGRTKQIGTPQPLKVPQRRWGSVTTDFITHLPKTSRGFDAITTFVDRLSRRVHFAPSRMSDGAVEVARTFMDSVFRLHGLPDEIVSDRDPKFTAKFWRELMKMCGVELKMSSSHHPQTDGLSEVINRMLGNYLRCFCNKQQKNWDILLSTAEYAYNSARTTGMNASPFEIDLGWTPLSPLDCFTKRESVVQSVEELRQRLAGAYADAKFSHQLAKARLSAYQSRKYTLPKYKVGDKVWISNQYLQDPLARIQSSNKLKPRRYGPFIIKELFGKSAVHIELPQHIKVTSCNPYGTHSAVS